MSENNGGPAFPRFVPEGHYNGSVDVTGMTLRDYFAGQALANPAICHSELGVYERAMVAYEQAEYMLKVRAQ